MKYRNIKTGAVINVSGEVSGADWVELPSGSADTKKAEPEKKEGKKPVKKGSRK